MFHSISLHKIGFTAMTDNLIENAAGASQETAPSGRVAVNDMLLGSLGFDQVEADPNAIPPGTYDAVVFSSEIVHVKSKNTVSHVVTYKITDGDYEGKRISKFHELGVNPELDENGKVTSYTPTQTPTNKQWHKKNFVDLGVPEANVSTTPISALTGRECLLTITMNNGFRNVAGVAPRGNTLPQAPTTPAGGVVTANDSAAPEPF